MIIKPRFESEELKVLRYLYRRLELSAKDENHYLNLEKGTAGELQFDRMLENLPDDWIHLNDLLLENNNTMFQIDAVLISSNTIYIFEVKNYEGDYYIENERWYSLTSKAEIKSPLLQLQRSETLLRGILKELGFNIPIKPNLVFVNPGFQLYQAPKNLSAIFPAQLNRFIEKLKDTPAATKARNMRFAEQLISRCLKENPYLRIPEYTYEQLEKGIPCLSCSSFLAPFRQGTLICKECGSKEELESAVLRSVDEFRTLFPERKVTSNDIYEWCSIISSTKVIQRILSRNYEIRGHGKYSFYVSKQDQN
ncbi:NERD domain-containing protein [Bacillus sp. ISL-47]|uniref:nuclease-related domain-containing protein n=1 Tax=Bacillus sp. ISL-47 TaxID=2819130 RepID=UPI001BEB9E67|nr:nuclease-related domain-containing protein [Bacillus sp. ISL-47]MBT2687619.1 NERD domain-containing protein [Bacillus sp. ISL-47]MBT2706384.1 NERD domain-containing protein [Pseudomonas sp. ISL-84]